MAEGRTQGPIPWPSALAVEQLSLPASPTQPFPQGFRPVELRQGYGVGLEVAFSFSLAEIQGPELIWEHSRRQREDPGVACAYTAENLVGLDVGVTKGQTLSFTGLMLSTAF